ncbi:hypothetical protein ADL22_31870 [Streptomyces sp. NRRL F-4489]|uniref:hypothetical protein n=1 Tax=Streptomyces sp. NRRL F-4489 TaxID=1609095 RepID=UPI0007469CAB|nr:hypothetical protein [Streptomyces sp. NRRL F-4489]KUL33886.1 hypothetical protein ADL22_31870 [Streptomyces sp. NRRL F-4489]
MAGFRALAEQVRNPRLVTARRRTALRKCLERFAPYGHRATWHHLCTRAGFAVHDREPDPARLVAALAELEEARALWLAYEEEFAARRRREKHEGIRQPGALDDWHRRTWGGYDIVPCVSPQRHPAARLCEVLRRVIAAMEAGRPRRDCPVCGSTRFVWVPGPEGCPTAGPACRECGVVAPVAVLAPETLHAAAAGAYGREASAAA